jgi:DNA-binding NarL/FixJ family response regulator
VNSTKILLADDHSLLLAAVKQTLEADGRFVVVGETRIGTEVLPLIARTEPDVVLLDIRMPGIDGLASLERIRARFPKVKVVIFSASASVEHVEAALARGASGYIVKTVEHDDLVGALDAVVEGRPQSQPVGLPDIDSEEIRARAAGLTDRELTIIKLLARGLSNQQLAKELWVTEQTVKFHLTNIYRKLGVANRTEAARWAHSEGFVEPQAYSAQG